jgi:hypothetical protein
MSEVMAHHCDKVFITHLLDRDIIDKTRHNSSRTSFFAKVDLLDMFSAYWRRIQIKSAYLNIKTIGVWVLDDYEFRVYQTLFDNERENQPSTI